MNLKKEQLTSILFGICSLGNRGKAIVNVTIFITRGFVLSIAVSKPKVGTLFHIVCGWNNKRSTKMLTSL